jgi:ATP-dependent DNA helicase RecG
MRVSISTEDRDKVLSVEEDHFCDLKAKEIAPSKLSQSVSAFANAAGGEIFVGVRESQKGATKERTWVGFSDVEEANSVLQMLNQIAPLADFISTTFLECEGESGLVLKIEILRNATITKSTDGIAYVRKGAQKLPIDTDEAYEKLRLDKGISSYETYKVKANIDVIENSSVTLDFLMGVVPMAEPEPWLRKQQLIIDDSPTVCGVLLFSEEPQALLPKRTAIKIFRYKTIENEPSRDHLAFDPITIEGWAYKLVYDAVAKTQELVEEIKKLGDASLKDVQYPAETLHEIITNAVLHRDYGIATDVQVRIFDNRIEIESPGRFSGHITKDNVLHSQFARNQQLVRLINKFPNPPNKDVGEGLNTAFDAMRKLRLHDPIILEQQSSILVTIPHQKLASPEEIVMEFLGNNSEVTNREARALCGVRSENSMKSVFKRLQKREMIEPVPGRSQFKAAWRKVQS